MKLLVHGNSSHSWRDLANRVILSICPQNLSAKMGSPHGFATRRITRIPETSVLSGNLIPSEVAIISLSKKFGWWCESLLRPIAGPVHEVRSFCVFIGLLSHSVVQSLAAKTAGAEPE